MPSAPTQLLVTALAGWADAGEAATAALRRLAKQFEATKFADLDPEEFYDFSQVRPYTILNRDGLRRIRWPANELFYSPTAMSGAGALLFLGVEPSLKWRTYAESIIDLGQRCGVSKVVHIGALLDAVPHTREILLTGSSNKKDMVETLEDHGIRALALPRADGHNFRGHGSVQQARHLLYNPLGAYAPLPARRSQLHREPCPHSAPCPGC